LLVLGVRRAPQFLTKHDAGWVLETKITPTVPPIGHCVHVFMQASA
jgi:hypothetical protein